MQAALFAVVSWLIRKVIIKFIVLTAVIVLVEFLVPIAIGYIAPFVNGDSITQAFSNLPSGILWFLNYFRVDFGLPLVISAFVARFLVRRLPVIG